MMKEIDEHILISYIDGTLTEEEVARVNEWLAASPENAKLLEQMYFTSEVASRLKVIQAVDTEGALRRFKSKVQEKKQKKEKRLVLRHVLGFMQRAAAVLFIPVFLITAYLLIQPGHSGVRMVSIRTNPGVISFFTLPDGSKVWLNAKSELRYPSDFLAETRTIELEGQGYFEVAKDPDKPFIVNAGKDYSVEVLGTTFNVSAYEDEDYIETTLVEGSVKLNIATPDGKRATRMLKPNEKAEFAKNNRELTVYDVNTENDIAWKHGELIFRNHPIDKVLKTLGRHYCADFKIKDNEVLKSVITARFKDEPLPQVMEYLRLASGIQYVIHKPEVKNGELGNAIVEISK